MKSAKEWTEKAIEKTLGAIDRNVSPQQAKNYSNIAMLIMYIPIIAVVPQLASLAAAVVLAAVPTGLASYPCFRGEEALEQQKNLTDNLGLKVEVRTAAFSLFLAAAAGAAGGIAYTDHQDRLAQQAHVESLPVLPSDANGDFKLNKEDLERIACTGKTGPIPVTVNNQEFKLPCP